MKRLLLAPLLFFLMGVPALARECSNTDYRVISRIKFPKGTSGTKFLTVPPGVSDIDIRNIASGSCGYQWCRLLIWDDPDEAAYGFPLSERQAKTQIAIYLHNPGTRTEQLMIRGKSFPMGNCTNLR